jgi:thiol:disulfide interchange protein DsbD
MPTSVRWELPAGFKAGGLHWPVPQRFDYDNGLAGYGYQGEVILLTEIQAPEQLEAGNQVILKAKAQWLSCAEICVPGQAEFSIPFSIAESEPVSNDVIRAQFDEQKTRWPVQKSDWQIEATGKDDVFVFRLTSHHEKKNIIKSAAFFPYRNDIIDHAAQQDLAEHDAEAVELAVQRSNFSDEWVQDLRGVMVLEQITPLGDQREGIYVDIPVLE